MNLKEIENKTILKKKELRHVTGYFSMILTGNEFSISEGSDTD